VRRECGRPHSEKCYTPKLGAGSLQDTLEPRTLKKHIKTVLHFSRGVSSFQRAFPRVPTSLALRAFWPRCFRVRVCSARSAAFAPARPDPKAPPLRPTRAGRCRLRVLWQCAARRRDKPGGASRSAAVGSAAWRNGCFGHLPRGGRADVRRCGQQGCAGGIGGSCDRWLQARTARPIWFDCTCLQHCQTVAHYRADSGTEVGEAYLPVAALVPP